MRIESVYMGTSPVSWGANKKIKYITFSVTDECNLRCSYCYFSHKTDKNVMSFETAQKAVDDILGSSGYLAYDGVVWEFIGGEPTLEMDLIDTISDYIVYRMYSLKHKWFFCYHFMIGTNGILYKSSSLQKYIKKHGANLYVAITIDGTKEKHDLSRKRKDGTGSYNDVIKSIPLWMKQFRAFTTKATFSHDDLPYLKDSIIHLWHLGIRNVSANVVFEDVWKPGDTELFKDQLYQLADYIIEKDLWNDCSVRFFDPINGTPIDDYQTRINYCGSGKMLAISTNGDYYPCVRFMPSAMNNHVFYKIGDAEHGINPDRLRSFSTLSLKNQSDKKCLECDVGGGCSWCSGLNFDCSTIGTLFERKTFTCEIHKATVEVNKYLWRKYEIIKKRISPYRYKKLTTISMYNKYLFIYGNNSFPALCGYVPNENYKYEMTNNTLSKSIEFCDKNNFVPIFCGFRKLPEDYFGYQAVLYRELQSGLVQEHDHYFTFIVAMEEEIDNNFYLKNEISCLIILTQGADLNELYKKIALVSNKHLNLNINISFNYDTSQLASFIKSYPAFLNKLTELIYTEWKRNNYLSINLLTNELFANSNRYCGAGRNTLTISPEGNIYICPAFYYCDKDGSLGSVDVGVNNYLFDVCNMDKAPLCSECPVRHCERCVFKNKTRTGEYSIPSEEQCVISIMEYKFSVLLARKLSELSLPFEIDQKLQDIDYYDPLQMIRGDDYPSHNLSSVARFSFEMECN